MAIYDTFKTGRQRTLVFEGDVAISALNTWDQTLDGGGGDFHTGFGDTACFGLTYFYYFDVVSMAQGLSGTARFTPIIQVRLRVERGGTGHLGTGTLVSDVTQTVVTGAEFGSALYQAAGHYRTELDVEEWLAVGPMPLGFGNDDGEPSWAPLGDGPPGIWARFFERQRSGSGTLRIAVSFGPLTFNLTASDSIAPVSVDYQTILDASVHGSKTSGNSASITGRVGSVALGYSHSGSVAGNITGAAYSVSGNTAAGAACALTGDLPLSADGSRGREGFVSLTRLIGVPAASVTIEGIVRSFQSPYSGNLLARWAPRGTFVDVPIAGGTFSASAVQQDVFSQVPGSQVTIADGQGQHGRFYAFINPDSLRAMGEESDDARMMAAGHVFDGWSLNHGPSITLDDGSSGAGWAAAAHTTVTSSGGSVKIAASGGVGGATRTFSPASNAEGFRYIDLSIRSEVGSAVPVSFQIGTKTWSITTGAPGVFVTGRIDTMAPDSWGAIPSGQDTRWPVDSVLSNTPANEAVHWGVNRIASLVVGGVPDGETIDIDSVALVTARSASGSVLSSHPSAFTLELPTTPTFQQFAKRFLLCDTDGRQSLEVKDRTDIISFGILTRTYQALSDLFSDCGRVPGWSPVGSDPAGAYYNWSLPAYFYGGGGLVYDAGQWKDFTAFASGQPIPCQFQFDMITLYPGIGDPWSGAGYNTDAPVTIRYSKLLRALGHGLALDSSQKPQASATVQLVEGSSIVGSGISDAGGYFATGPVHGRSTHAETLKSGSSTLGTFTAISRKKHRVNGLVQSGEGFPFNRCARHGIYHRSSLRAGDVVYRRARGSTPAGGWDSEVVVTNSGDVVDRAAHVAGYGGRIYLHYARHVGGSYNTYLRHSDDRGSSWSDEAMAITGGRYPDARFAEQGKPGTLIVPAFVYNAGASGPGTIQAQRQRPGEANLSATFTMKDHTGANLQASDQGFSLTPMKEGAARWLLAFTVDGEAATSEWWSASECETFTRVT